MIRVIMKRRADGRIAAFSVSGHAEYDRSGKDIVCAGVSAVTVGTVNAIETLTRVELPSTMKHGLLRVEVPDGLEPELDEKVQLLLESMLVMIDSIREEYGRYIDVQHQVLENRR
ncbi:ribosomal-processing cysteine protease Prp [Paenibacillus sp. HJGM_3]|uniref:ribosomal-processing cysteine protease Prp n=1 Tax=Paenibacillus sp. HJGM_3 TaxID=3379816 RepID=UPI00385CCC2A